MDTITTDFLLIGSGFGAAAPALRLVENGHQVLMIEMGRDIVPERDFNMTQDPKHLLKYIKSLKGDGVQLTYAVGLGGGSGFYEMVSFRAPSKAFEQTDERGKRLWPRELTRNSMNRYYDLAEKMMKVRQIEKDEIPKNGIVFARMMKNLGYSVDRANYAVNNCRGAAYCVAGCKFGSKQTLHNTYLDMAGKKGLKIITNVEAMQILPEDESGSESEAGIEKIPHRYRVLCKSTLSGQMIMVRAKVVILGAGTVGSAKLVLNSLDTLGMVGGYVGKNIGVNGSVKALGILPDDFMQGDMFTGMSHPGVVSFEFLESRGITVSTAKPMPVDALATAHFTLGKNGSETSWWGKDHVEFMKLYRRRAMVVFALGLTTSTAELRKTGRNRYKPVFSLSSDFREYYRSTISLLHSILTENKARIVNVRFIDGEGNEYSDIHISTAHMTGSCRMADSMELGVADKNGEFFNRPGLFVSDGAAIPSSLAVNPYLTILANAERIAESLVDRYHKN